MMDRTPPVQDGRLLGHVAAMLGLFGTCDMLLEPQEGQRLAHLMVIDALKGPTSPFRGLTSLHFCSLLAFSM
jgi:hypothetical protein